MDRRQEQQNIDFSDRRATVNDHDLVVEIHTLVKGLDKRVTGIESELKERKCLLHSTQIETLQHDFDPRVCAKNTTKIAIIEKLTWGALLTGVGLVIKSLWDAITK